VEARMNTLAFRTTDENGLSFELLGELLGAQDCAFPFWGRSHAPSAAGHHKKHRVRTSWMRRVTRSGDPVLFFLPESDDHYGDSACIRA